MFEEDKIKKKKLDDQDEIKRLQLMEDFKMTFEQPCGKRVLWHLLERCHIFSSTFTGNAKSHFLEGERNIGLYLLHTMELSSQEGLERLKQLKPRED